MNKKHLPVLAVFAIFFACVTLAFCGAAIISIPQRPIQAVAQAAPAQPVEPAQQPPPQPTATPIPPTETPAPTPTPILPTPKPEIPVEVQAYFSSVAQKNQVFGNSMTELGKLLQAYEPTDQWKIKVSLMIAMIQTTHENLAQMDVPADMEGIHTALISATHDCYIAMPHLTKGIDDNDTNEVLIASQLMTSCKEKLKEPGRLVLEYKAQFQ